MQGAEELATDLREVVELVLEFAKPLAVGEGMDQPSLAGGCIAKQGDKDV